ncbi:MAG: ferrochelatase [Candidatus Kryptoniota bacterium]
MSKVGIVLFNLGGPHSLDDIEEFLYNLFMDPYIINLPVNISIRRIFAHFVARRRAQKTRFYYEVMGGKSPQYELTLKQARALENKLKPVADVRTYVGMRYFKPTIEDAYRALAKDNIEKVILLPLYPHYSRSTTMSSFEEWNRVTRDALDRMKVLQIESYHNFPPYIEAVASRISETLEKFPASVRQNVHILFSAHGIPESLVKKGDPYKSQIEETVKLVGEKFDNKYSLSYQSRVGPVKWLGPKTMNEIKRLAESSVKYLLVVPISFVNEHSETLYEINYLFRQQAESSGILQFEMMPALNDSPRFIDALARLVIEKLKEF